MTWFADWFNSPFYHKLYKNRDESEAQYFIDNLVAFLKPNSKQKILDLACGKGRHAIYLNTKGFDVEACDLAPDSIAFAKKYENEKLHFFVHDMRDNLTENKYDLVLNLFTSFGYFENLDENLKTLKSVNQSLKKNGKLVIDFFNTDFVLQNLIPKEQKIIDGTIFNITKSVKNNIIFKEINFESENKNHEFIEQVQALKKSDFEFLLAQSGFKIETIFGNYKLEKYDAQTSERLIIVATKI
ncbi:MAG: class I SAM-dependent methyltransferase [Bacteroidetes bacterium]|nr:MAG: class I SAM-dependent methyltransferase [Bacteroidota bacterium]